jgi:hypothetical protein
MYRVLIFIFYHRDHRGTEKHVHSKDFFTPRRGVSGKPRVKRHEQSECMERGVRDVEKDRASQWATDSVLTETSGTIFDGEVFFYML